MLGYLLLDGILPRLYGQFRADIIRYLQASSSKLAALNVLKYSIWISRGSGLVLTFDGALILLPMCRNLLKWLRPTSRWIPLDESVWFHRQVAYALLIFTIIHTASHYVK